MWPPRSDSLQAQMRSRSRSSRSALTLSLKWRESRRFVPVLSPSASSRTRPPENLARRSGLSRRAVSCSAKRTGVASSCCRARRKRVSEDWPRWLRRSRSGAHRIRAAGRTTHIAAAWRSIGARAAVAEKALDLECEISVMAARNPSGEVRSYPAARNHHENQILAWSVLPAGVPAELESRAEALAAAIIAKLGIEGLLCVEIFVTQPGRTARQRTRAPPAQQLSPKRTWMRDQPV